MKKSRKSTVDRQLASAWNKYNHSVQEVEKAVKRMNEARDRLEMLTGKKVRRQEAC